MAIRTLTTFDSSGRHVFELKVSVEGWTLAVAAGTVRIAGEDLDLKEHTYDHGGSHTNKITGAVGFLVKVGRQARLFVDRYEDGEEPYVFMSDGPFQLLDKLFSLVVPPGAPSLEEADLTVRRVIPNPSEES